MKTLRTRLLLGTAVGTALVLSVAALLLYTIVRAALWSEFDESLVSKARSLAALVEQDRHEIELEFDHESLPEYRPGDRAEYYQFWMSSGSVLARSPSLKGANLEPPNAGAPACADIVLPDGRRGRVARIVFTPRQDEEHEEHEEHGEGRRMRSGERLTLAVARETYDVDQTLGRLRLLLACGSLGAILLSVLVLLWFVRRGLAPLARVAADIAAIDEGDLSGRLEAGAAPEELMPVVARLNDLLARLEAAFARERGFTADVAHELRTPLAALRTTLEVSLAKERGDADYRSAVTTSLAVSKQMQHLIENLLELARADAGQLETAIEQVDLAPMLKECWAEHTDGAAKRNLQVQWQLPQVCVLDTDSTKAKFVLSNLLDNAATYTDTGGSICVELREEPDSVSLRIDNTGSKVDRADADRVFDRFWRGDAARSREAEQRRYGLGLPLCRQLITFMGGTVEVTTAAGGTFSVSVRFPN